MVTATMNTSFFSGSGSEIAGGEREFVLFVQRMDINYVVIMICFGLFVHVPTGEVSRGNFELEINPGAILLKE